MFWPAAAVGADTPPSASAGDAAPVRGPATPADGKRNDGDGGPRRTGRPTTQAGGQNRPPGPNVSWEEVSAFMSENSPRKWASFRTLNPRESRGFIDNITNRYATLKRLQRFAPDEYELEVGRVRIEDGIFGAMVDYHKAPTPEKKQAAEADMKGRVGELIENHQQLWKVRLENKKKRLAAVERQGAELKADIASLGAELDKYAADRDELVKKQAEQFLKKQGFGPRPGARGRGPDGDGWKDSGTRDSADRRDDQGKRTSGRD